MARVIIKGFRMTAGLDYNETFAPQPNVTTYRLLFAMAAEGDWEIKQGDEPTAFLKPLMDTTVYVKVGDWFFNPTPSFDPAKFSYHKLIKTIPGVPQGPRPVLQAQQAHTRAGGVWHGAMPIRHRALCYSRIQDFSAPVGG